MRTGTLLSGSILAACHQGLFAPQLFVVVTAQRWNDDFFKEKNHRVMIKVGCNAFIGCTHSFNCWHAFSFQGSWANLQPSSALRSGKSLQQLDTGPLFCGQSPFRFQSFRCQQVSDLKPSGRARSRPPEDIDQAGVEVVQFFKVKGKASARNLHQIILTGLKPYAICGHSRICSWHSTCLQTDRRHRQLTMAFYGTSEMTWWKNSSHSC